jgi:hypothetical protein
VICPTGAVCEFLSSPRAKNISLPFFRNMWFASRIRFWLRGALRGRHERWDGMRWTRQRRARRQRRASEPRERVSRARKTNGVEAYGKSVWSWHPLLVSSRRRPVGPTGCAQVVNSSATEARRIRLRGEYAIRRNTIAWGMPDVSGASAVNTGVHTQLTIAHTRLRVHWAPGIPRALGFPRGRTSWQNLGRKAPRRLKACLQWRGTMPHSRLSSSATGSRGCAPDDRLQRTIQHSRGIGDGTDEPRRTGCPACAWHDRGG